MRICCTRPMSFRAPLRGETPRDMCKDIGARVGRLLGPPALMSLKAPARNLSGVVATPPERPFAAAQGDSPCPNLPLFQRGTKGDSRGFTGISLPKNPVGAVREPPAPLATHRVAATMVSQASVPARAWSSHRWPCIRGYGTGRDACSTSHTPQASFLRSLSSRRRGAGPGGHGVPCPYAITADRRYMAENGAVGFE